MTIDHTMQGKNKYIVKELGFHSCSASWCCMRVLNNEQIYYAIKQHQKGYQYDLELHVLLKTRTHNNLFINVENVLN